MAHSSIRRFRHIALSSFLVALVSATLAHAKCNPDAEPDKSDIANARAAVAAHCPCTPIKLPGGYASCAVKQANLVLANKSCRAFIKGCALHSTCGKPGFVTCCRTTKKGTAKCEIKSSTTKCVPPKGGTACVASHASCCDACANGTCVGSTTTTSITTTTEPAPTTTSTEPPTTTSTEPSIPTTTEPPVPTTTTTLPLPTCSVKGAPCGSCVPNGNCLQACSAGCAFVCVVQYNPLTTCTQDSDCPVGSGAVCVAQPTQDCPTGCRLEPFPSICAVPCE